MKPDWAPYVTVPLTVNENCSSPSPSLFTLPSVSPTAGPKQITSVIAFNVKATFSFEASVTVIVPFSLPEALFWPITQVAYVVAVVAAKAKPAKPVKAHFVFLVNNDIN